MDLETAEMFKGLMDSMKTNGDAVSTNMDSMTAMLAMIKVLGVRVGELEKKAGL